MKEYRKRKEFAEEEISLMEAKIRLAEKKLKLEMQEGDEEKDADDGYQTIANFTLIVFLGVVFYKVMTGTF